MEFILLILSFITVSFGIVGLSVVIYAIIQKTKITYKQDSYEEITSKSKTLIGKIDSILTSSLFWALGSLIILGALILFFLLNLLLSPGTIIEITLTSIIALVLSIVGSLFYAGLIWLLDYKSAEPLKIFPTLFILGSLAAIGSFFLNTSFGLINIIAFSSNTLLDTLLVVLLGPIIEEALKGTGLYLMSRSKYFDGIFDGFVYGFIIGMGFSFIENVVYLTQYPPMDQGLIAWFFIIGFRVLITSFGHGIFTGMAGIIFAFGKGRAPDILNFGTGIGLAVLIHGIYNGILTLTESIGMYFVYVLILLGIFIVMAFIGITENKKRRLANKM